MIRPAVAADAEAIAALEAECLGADAWSPALVAEGVSGDLPTIAYVVAEVEGVVAGYAAASVSGHPADPAELQRIAVAPTARRVGLAAALLDRVLALAKEGRADRVLLEVRADNHGALAFYAASGFVEIDRRRRYYHDGADALVLRRGIGPACGGG